MSAWGGAGAHLTATPDPYSDTSAASIPRGRAAHKVPTKQARVLRALLAGPADSQQLEEAPVFDHCANSTVSELRKRGFAIRTEMIRVEGYSGQGAHIARYHLLPESRAAAEKLAAQGPGVRE